MHTRWSVLLLLLVFLTCDATLTNLRDNSKASRSLYSKKRGKERNSKLFKSGKEYVPDVGPWSSDANEPTCEQLREMWRQSKRHSRAAESTNEIPQYLDPFARGYPYAKQLQSETTPLRPRSERRPLVYGRVVHGPAENEPQMRAFDVLRTISSNYRGPQRSSGSDTGVVLQTEEETATFPLQPPARGSFHKLRELVKEDRARESADFPKGRVGTSDDSWPGDEGRIVTSPSEHKLFHPMQSDSPYGSRPFEVLRSNRWRNTDSKVHRQREHSSNADLREAEELLREIQNEELRKRRRHTVGKPTSTWLADDVQQHFARDTSEKFQTRSECMSLNGHTCLSSADCVCPGLRRCHHGRCQAKRLDHAERDDFATWQEPFNDDLAALAGNRRRRTSSDQRYDGQDFTDDNDD